MEEVLEDFLRERGVTEDIILKMKEDKIDCNVIKMMEDDHLAKYITAFGDRLAIVTFVEKQLQKDHSNKNLIDRLKQKFSKTRKRKNADLQEKVSKLNGNSNAKKENRRLELGWLDYRDELGEYKQVRSVSGGGTRHLSVDVTITIKDILETGKHLFFPGGVSKRGEISRFKFSVMSYNCCEIDNMDLTVGEMYEDTKFKLLRLYLATKRFSLDDIPTKSDESSIDEYQELANSTLCTPETSTSSSSTPPVTCNITNGSSTSNSISYSATSAQEYLSLTVPAPNYIASSTTNGSISSCNSSNTETTSQFNSQIGTHFVAGTSLTESSFPVEEYNHGSLESFSEYADGSDREITFRNASVTNLLEEVSLPIISFNSNRTQVVENATSERTTDESNSNLNVIKIRRGFAFDDLKSEFKNNPKLIDTNLNVVVIEPNGKSEKGEGIGVLRDILTEFWQTFYEQCTLGNEVKVPYIRHDFQERDWRSIAQIFVKGWFETEYLPLKIASPFIKEVIGEATSEEDLIQSFLLYIADSESEVIKSAMKDFESVDYEDVIEVLDSYNCKRSPTKDNLKEILSQIAHKELIQAPMFVIDSWKPVLSRIQSILTNEILTSMMIKRKPTQKNIIKHLMFPESMSNAEQDISKYLIKYLKEASQDILQRFLRFCTGSDIVLDQYITVYFIQMKDFERRPIGRTCTSMLQLANTYTSYPEFRTEFNSVLNSSVWNMDFV